MESKKAVHNLIISSLNIYFRNIEWVEQSSNSCTSITIAPMNINAHVASLQSMNEIPKSKAKENYKKEHKSNTMCVKMK